MSRTPLICLTILALWQSAVVAADEGSTPGEIRTDATPNSISVEWDLTGDTDHDATCSVQYRQQESDKWLEALPPLRIDYQWWYHTERADKPLNLFAGSLMFLKPSTTYEVRLDLADPDGGTATKTASVATRPIPKLRQDGRTLHIVPGSAGGSGSADNPFQGMTTAQEAAKPGDIMLLHQGDYGSFAFDKSGESGKYLVWKAAGDGKALFSAIRVNGSHLWFEGLHLKRSEEPNGLRASDRTTDVVIRGC